MSDKVPDKERVDQKTVHLTEIRSRTSNISVRARGNRRVSKRNSSH